MSNSPFSIHFNSKQFKKQIDLIQSNLRAFNYVPFDVQKGLISNSLTSSKFAFGIKGLMWFIWEWLWINITPKILIKENPVWLEYKQNYQMKARAKYITLGIATLQTTVSAIKATDKTKTFIVWFLLSSPANVSTWDVLGQMRM